MSLRGDDAFALGAIIGRRPLPTQGRARRQTGVAAVARPAFAGYGMPAGAGDQAGCWRRARRPSSQSGSISGTEERSFAVYG